MHTSTHIRPAIHYSQIGPGGWHCRCCAPQSGNKYAAQAKAQLRRQAKKRERAAFTAEQVRLELAAAESLIIEQRIAEDEYQDKCNAIQETAEESARRDDKWLDKMIGQTVWEPKRIKANDKYGYWPFYLDRLPVPAVLDEMWMLAYIDWAPCDYSWDEKARREYKAAVAIDRTHQQWIVWTDSDQRWAYDHDNPTAAFTVHPLAEHSLEEMQRLAATIERLAEI